MLVKQRKVGNTISLASGGSLEGTFRGTVLTAVKISDSTSNFTTGAVSFANDGINITWAKAGSGGTGSARIQIIAFRHKE